MTVIANTEVPLVFSPGDVCRCYGIGKTQLYAEIKAGRIRARKLGRRTLIAAADVQSWFDSLPVSKREAA